VGHASNSPELDLENLLNNFSAEEFSWMERTVGGSAQLPFRSRQPTPPRGIRMRLFADKGKSAVSPGLNCREGCREGGRK
jgi:hypothetical protein